jgi:hypothetical protein
MGYTRSLMPFLTIFQFYHGSQFNWERKTQYPDKTTNLPPDYYRPSCLNYFPLFQSVTDMVDGNKIIMIFYFIYCVCANYKCCSMPSRGPDLENKVSCTIDKLRNQPKL